MKYGVMPKVMWMVFEGTFKEAIVSVLQVQEATSIMRKAKRTYKEILLGVDEFDKGDRFIMNILSAAMLASVYMNLDQKPSVEQMTEYYKTAMTQNFWLRKSVTRKGTYTERGRQKLKEQALKSQSNTNPYSWKFTVEDGKTINQYTATFTTCGICYLFKQLGIEELVLAMCPYDYDMAALNHTKFSRQYTLASGGPYCDCHYDHQER